MVKVWWEAGHAVFRSLVVDQELMVRVGKSKQFLVRLSVASLASLRVNDDPPEWEFRLWLSVYKEPNEILVGRHQTLRQVLA